LCEQACYLSPGPINTFNAQLNFTDRDLHQHSRSSPSAMAR
jgi:hypothetical protein